MYILFNDIVQYSDAEGTLKSPALSEISPINNITITLDRPRPINSIGIGNTDGLQFSIYFDNNESFEFQYTNNGLYVMNKTVETQHINIATDASFIGRFGCGRGIHIPTSPKKEFSYNSTANDRTTLSGQIVAGAGGYYYKTVSLDSRYKLDKTAIQEISDGYKFISMCYPFFIDLTEEFYKLPFSKFYGIEKNQKTMSFESGILKPLYSRRFEFEERF